MSEEQIKWLNKALEIIKGGLIKRLDKPDGTIKVYTCGENVVRIDLSGRGWQKQ